MKPRTVLWIALLAIGHMLYANDKSNVGVYLTSVAGQFGINLELSGLISTIAAAGQAVAGLIAGWVMAKNGTKSTLMLGLGIASLAMLLSSFSTNAWQFLTLRVVVGFGQGFWIVAYTAFVGFAFAKRRGLAIATFLAMYDVGLLWGNPVSGFLIQATSTWRTVPAVFGEGGLVLMVISLFAIPSISDGSGQQSPLPGMFASVKSVLATRDVSLAVFISFAWSLYFFAILGLLPTYLNKVIGFSTLDAAILTAMFSLGSLFMGPPVAALSDKFGRKKIILASGLATTFAALLLFDFLPNPTIIEAGAAILVAGAAQVAGYSVVSSFIQDSTPTNEVGYAMGVLNLMVSVGAALSGLLLGVTVTAAGWRFGGLWLGICGVSWCLMAVSIHESGTHPAREVVGRPN